MTRAATKTAPEKGGPPGAAPGPYEDTPPTTADSKQLARMHGLLAAHGINGDVTRHDWLTAAVGRPITSASDLTKVETAHVIHDLEVEDVPEARTASAKQLRDLRAAFPAEAVGKLPRVTCKACRDSQRKRCDQHSWVSRCEHCGNSHSSAAMHIDFVGHADVTARLLEVDPAWTYRPFTPEEIAGIPPGLRDGLWIMLTVCGITRPGFGEGTSGQQKGGDQVKVAIGDALRNAAMRFGVALDLWTKGDRDWSKAEKHGAEQMAPDDPPPQQDTPAPPWDGPTAGSSVAALMEHAKTAGTDLAGITARWREAHGGMTVDDLHHAPAADLWHLAQQVGAYLAAHPTVAAEAAAVVA